MARKNLTTVDDVVDALGGTGAVAALTDRTPPAVSNWRAEGRIPPRMFMLMSKALREAGYTASPALWGMDVAGAA